MFQRLFQDWTFAGVRDMPKLFGFCAVLVALCIVGCQTTNLEYRDVGKFSVSQITADPVTLKVSGWPQHSALVVKRVNLIRKGRMALIKADMVLASRWNVNPEGTSNFSYVYEVPPDVNMVAFGTSDMVIWRRDFGIVQIEKH